MMLTAKQLMQIVLGLIQFANWISTKIDNAELRKQGYDKRITEELVALNTTLGLADAAVVAANKATPEERRKSLEDDL